MAFAIEKNVPIPRTGAGPNEKYPFKSMEIGDSFLVPLNGEPEKTVRSRVASSAYNRPKHGKFACIVTDQGIRVWRVA